MEATPPDFDIVECFKDCLEIDEVDEIHDFHVWALSVGKIAMSAHIRSPRPQIAIHKITEIMRNKYECYHSTVQVEEAIPFSLDIITCDNDKIKGEIHIHHHSHHHH